MRNKTPPASTDQQDEGSPFLGVMVRSSSAMVARRRRILSETRKMIAQAGIDALSMRALAAQAGVSLRTLYNAFGSKEALIAAAIRQYYDKFLRAISEDRDPYDFAFVIDTVIATNLRNRQIRPYLAALIGQYFQHSSDPAIRLELRRVASGFALPWLEVTRARGQLRPGADMDRIVWNLSSLQYAINQEWHAGALPDADFLPAILDGLLSYLAGVTCGEAHGQVTTLMDDLHGGRRIVNARIEAGRARLDALFSTPSLFLPLDHSADAATAPKATRRRKKTKSEQETL